VEAKSIVADINIDMFLPIRALENPARAGNQRFGLWANRAAAIEKSLWSEGGRRS